MSFSSESPFGHLRGDEHLPGALGASGAETLRPAFRHYMIGVKLTRWTEETQHEIERDGDVEAVLYAGETYRKIFSLSELLNLSMDMKDDELMQMTIDAISGAFSNAKKKRVEEPFHIITSAYDLSDEEFLVNIQSLGSGADEQREAA